MNKSACHMASGKLDNAGLFSIIQLATCHVTGTS